MTTFFLDAEGGNDSNDGTTFANRWKTFTTGATAARTAPGDTVRVMASPAATSLGINGTWTDGPMPAYVSIASSTNATPIVITLSAGNYTTLAPAVGDTVIIVNHTTNTKANGTWKVSAVNGSTTVTIVNADGTNSVGNGIGGATGSIGKRTSQAVILASALTKNIALTGNQGIKTNWTASSNVVCSALTYFTNSNREGVEYQKIAVNGTFTTGLSAFWATGTLDLSTYQQVSFFVRQTAGTVATAGDVSIRLCTDTVGAVSVHTVNIPALVALDAERWTPVTIDLGTNMNSGIKSVALYVDTDRGAVTFELDNIIACKASANANSLTLTSLIGKNAAGETWYPIASINDVRVMLDQGLSANPTVGMGYSGTTESVTTYKRETIKQTRQASNTATLNTVQESGAAGSFITYSGGWDRSAMSSLTDETWWDGQNGYGVLASIASRSFIALSKINGVRFASLFVDTSATSNQFTDVAGNGLQVNLFTSAAIGDGTILNNVTANNGGHASGGTPGPMIQMSGQAVSGTSLTCNNTTNQSISFACSGAVFTGTVTSRNVGQPAAYQVQITGNNNDLAAMVLGGLTTNGLLFSGNRNLVRTLTQAKSLGYGIAANATEGNVIGGGSTSNNTIGGLLTTTGQIFLRNFTINETAKVASPTVIGSDAGVYMENYAGTTDDHRAFGDNGIADIKSQTATRHAASGIAWQISPQSTLRTTTLPRSQSVAKVAVRANALVTASIWARRDDTTELNARLRCKGGQIAGVASDTSASAAGAANAWEQLTVTFTPTEAGVVELLIEAWGGTTRSAYFDDLTVTQA